jgi:hypothetical protein
LEEEAQQLLELQEEMVVLQVVVLEVQPTPA